LSLLHAAALAARTRYRPTDPLSVRSGNGVNCGFTQGDPAGGEMWRNFTSHAQNNKGTLIEKPEFLCVFWLIVVKGSEMHFFGVVLRALYALPGKRQKSGSGPVFLTP